MPKSKKKKRGKKKKKAKVSMKLPKMKASKAKRILILLLLIGFTIIFVSIRFLNLADPKNAPDKDKTSANRNLEEIRSRIESKPWFVKRVVDGDTIVVDFKYKGKDLRVRYLLIDTPETVKQNHPVELFGPEASEFNKQFVEKKWVWLETDKDLFDRYGRLLAFVYPVKNENINKPSSIKSSINAKLIKEGLAKVKIYPPNRKYENEFIALQNEAKEKKINIWNSEN